MEKINMMKKFVVVVDLASIMFVYAIMDFLETIVNIQPVMILFQQIAVVVLIMGYVLDIIYVIVLQDIMEVHAHYILAIIFLLIQILQPFVAEVENVLVIIIVLALQH
jgi:hypothetical protein